MSEDPPKKKRRKLKLVVSEGVVCGKCEGAFSVIGVDGQRKQLKFCPWCGHPTATEIKFTATPKTWGFTPKLEPVIKAKRDGVIDVTQFAEFRKGTE